MMAMLVKERVLLKVSGSKYVFGGSHRSLLIEFRKKSVTQELKDIWNNIHILPHVIRQIVSFLPLGRKSVI